MRKEPYPSETADRYIVRFPEGMRERLKDEAASNNRSLNAEIIARLERTLDPDQNIHPAALAVTEEIVERVIRKIRAQEQATGASKDDSTDR